jgi:hypothetical protein
MILGIKNVQIANNLLFSEKNVKQWTNLGIVSTTLNDASNPPCH